jgi:hypothetical protein
MLPLQQYSDNQQAFTTPLAPFKGETGVEYTLLVLHKISTKASRTGVEAFFCTDVVGRPQGKAVDTARGREHGGRESRRLETAAPKAGPFGAVVMGLEPTTKRRIRWSGA